MADWIYVAAHEHMPGLVKIGQSQRDDPRTVRVPELGSSTGVPGAYVCKYQAAVSNYEGLEGEIHSTLRSYRIVENREHFRCSIAKAISTVRLLAKVTREDDFRSSDELAIALRDEKIQNEQDVKRVNAAVVEAYRLHKEQVDLRVEYILANTVSKGHWLITCFLWLGILPAFFLGWVILIDLTKFIFLSFESFLLKDPLGLVGYVFYLSAYLWFALREASPVSQERKDFVAKVAKSRYPSIDCIDKPSEIELRALKEFSKSYGIFGTGGSGKKLGRK